MSAARVFLRSWLISVLSLGFIVAALNLAVDPYDVFGTPRIPGISTLKPGSKNHAQMTKPYQLARIHPATVVIGPSSVHIGIDAAAPQWPAAMRPVYNYAIPGAYATKVSLDTLREAIAAGGVQNAVVFLDFPNYFDTEKPVPTEREDERRYRLRRDGSPNPDRRMQQIQDMFLSLATTGALQDSLRTIAGQRNPMLLSLAANGSSNEADFIREARTGGMHDLFAQKDAFEAKRAREVRPIMAQWQGPLPNLDVVAAMLDLARANHVTLTLVLSPHHADAMELYWRNGLWPRVEQLKSELAAMAAQGGAILWDFIDYSAFNTDAVPAAGDTRTPTSWFWEPTHFKKQLGEVMIERMFGDDGPMFGTPLTPRNVAARNAEVRKERQEAICHRRAPKMLTALDETIPDLCGAQ
jgi:hypothetical protein